MHCHIKDKKTLAFQNKIRYINVMKHYIWYILAPITLILFISGCATGPKPPRGIKPVDRTIETTGYCACKKCCNWKRNWYGKTVVASGAYKGAPKKVGITASGLKARKGTIAADTTRYPFGTVMYIPGYGYGRVEDRGSAIKGEKIDLFFKSHKDALRWGRQTHRVRIWPPS